MAQPSSGMIANSLGMSYLPVEGIELVLRKFFEHFQTGHQLRSFGVGQRSRDRPRHQIHSVLIHFDTKSGSAASAIPTVSGLSSASRPIGTAASTSSAALASTTHCSIDRTRGCCARRPKVPTSRITASEGAAIASQPAIAPGTPSAM